MGWWLGREADYVACGKFAVFLAESSRHYNSVMGKLTASLAGSLKHYHLSSSLLWLISLADRLNLSLRLMALGGRLDVDVKHLSVST